MRLSRDEAREIAATALMLVIGLRLLAGVFQMVDELSRSWTWSSLLGRLLAPVGSTLGLFALGLTLVLVLSPSGSISMGANRVATVLVGAVAGLGALSVVNGLVQGGGGIGGRLSFVLLNGSAAAVLGGAAWWILKNFEPER